MEVNDNVRAMADLSPNEKPAVGRCEERILLPLPGIELGFISFPSPSHLCPVLPRGSHPSDFPTQILCAFLISTMQTTRPTHIIILDMIPLIIILLNITTHETLRQAIFFVLALFPLSLVQIFRSRLCTQTFSKYSIQ
jgi:hypothetical protein